MSETGAGNDASTLTAPPAGPTPPSRRRLIGKPRRSTVVLGVIALVSGVAFATVFAFLVTSLTGKSGQPPVRTTGIPKTVSTKLATMMQLSPVPVTKAPNFTLTDQSGHPVSLASLHGRPVVLSSWIRTAPTSARWSRASSSTRTRTSAPPARNVVFIAVNVNPYHHRTPTWRRTPARRG